MFNFECENDMKNIPTHEEAMRQAQYLSLTEYQGFMKCFHWMIEYSEEAEKIEKVKKLKERIEK